MHTYYALANGSPPSRKGSVLQVVLSALLCVLLVGCQTQPPLRERQEAALQSLGFVESNDGWLLNLAAPIQFDVGRDDLKPETRQIVGEVADALWRIGIRRVRVEGHTDSVGARDFNVDLSRRRADAVAREMMRHGFADAAVVRRAWAYDYPTATNNTVDGRAQNRRVAIVVLAPDLSAP